jgi:hypothetical protein
MIANGYEQITGLSAVKTLTPPAGSRYALIGCTTQNVRWRMDGTDPTATVGNLLIAGANPELFDGNLAAMEFIEAAASAVLNVQYFKD